MIEGTILLVGSGRMGGALLEGWFKHGLNPVDVIVIEPAGRGAVASCNEHRALTVLPHVQDVPSDFHPDIIVFAVKPQIADEIVFEYASFTASQPVLLSVVAGKKASYFRHHLGVEAAIVRAMPNTPAMVGKAISILYAAPAVSAVQRRVCEVLMGAVGKVEWIDDEALMDAVTALSGSGPAYVFLLAECMRDAGIKAGLPADLSARLAHATLSGAGAMLEQEIAEPEVLRKNVTSPGGTTAAAMSILMAEGGLKKLLEQAVLAAAKRSKELAD
ncbi:MAG TPA: pyrroline-5-carboxylate reductase [Rhodospirillaceae bacterium]|nr:pyrroline-5-carboxylate reductase [Candidatus Neomarinimicrobiota bacterium]HCX15038.1 pyrroline-5-carboxylate reductase [Rhodospirillaceae bacterium]|tara:strand:- start:191 stop:1012 length:822 start_codon:yes stop_codon:yes gene_type:complete